MTDTLTYLWCRTCKDIFEVGTDVRMSTWNHILDDHRDEPDKRNMVFDRVTAEVTIDA